MAITMVYDLETVPDVVTGRQILGLPEGTDKEIAEGLVARREQQTQGSSAFLPHYLHQIVTISVVVSTPEWVKVWSLGKVDSKEPEIIRHFFDGIERFTPTLVSWNGSGFDLPVLHYRSLLHGAVSPKYWETGDNNANFRWNNYLGRYHQRHTDMMDVLAGYQNRAYAPLDEIALMLGLPGKMGMDGSKVWEKYQAGECQSIREYCETDVLNTYLVYLRFQYIRGQWSKEQVQFEEERLRKYLEGSEKPHFLAFANAWKMYEYS